MQAQRADAPAAGGLMRGSDYSGQWRDLRIRTWLSMLMFVLFIPMMAFGTFVLNAISPGLGNRGSFWLFAGWGVVAAFTSVYQISFRCPGGGWFGSGDSWTSPLARRCLHCGLARYANPSEPT